MNIKKYTSYDFILPIIFVIVLLLTNLLIDNDIIKNIINTVFVSPMALAIAIILNKPDNFIKLCNIKSKNLRYQFIAKLTCDLDEDMYKKIICGFGNNKKKLIFELGEYIYKTTIEFNTANLDILYNINTSQLMITTEKEINSKYFYKQCSDIIKIYKNLFSSEYDFRIEEECIQIKIIYLNDYGDNITNPFVYNFFKCFSKKSFKLSYVGNKNSNINIDNNCVSFSNYDINGIFEDIRKTLYFYKKRL